MKRAVYLVIVVAGLGFVFLAYQNSLLRNRLAAAVQAGERVNSVIPHVTPASPFAQGHEPFEVESPAEQGSWDLPPRETHNFSFGIGDGFRAIAEDAGDFTHALCDEETLETVKFEERQLNRDFSPLKLSDSDLLDNSGYRYKFDKLFRPLGRHAECLFMKVKDASTFALDYRASKDNRAWSPCPNEITEAFRKAVKLEEDRDPLMCLYQSFTSRLQQLYWVSRTDDTRCLRRTFLQIHEVWYELDVGIERGFLNASEDPNGHSCSWEYDYVGEFFEQETEGFNLHPLLYFSVDGKSYLSIFFPGSEGYNFRLYRLEGMQMHKISDAYRYAG